MYRCTIGLWGAKQAVECSLRVRAICSLSSKSFYHLLSLVGPIAVVVVALEVDNFMRYINLLTYLVVVLVVVVAGPQATRPRLGP